MPYLIVCCGFLIALIIVRIALGNCSGILKIEFGTATTSGKRQINADQTEWAYFGEELMLSIADGIGSGDKAKTAARVGVHVLSRIFELTGVGQNPAYFFMNGFRGVNMSILRYIPDSTAGASLLCAVIKDSMLYYALAGNCKISVLRSGTLYDLSEGHTFDVLVRRAFQRQKISRIEALEAVQESRIYNFVGKDGFRDLELFDTPVKLKRGDVILLMTDGVYEFCSSGALCNILASKNSCSAMAHQIIKDLDQSNRPDQDNATLIVARVNAI